MSEKPRSKAELEHILVRHILGAEKAGKQLREDVGTEKTEADPFEEKTVVDERVLKEQKKTEDALREVRNSLGLGDEPPSPKTETPWKQPRSNRDDDTIDTAADKFEHSAASVDAEALKRRIETNESPWGENKEQLPEKQTPA